MAIFGVEIASLALPALMRSDRRLQQRRVDDGEMTDIMLRRRDLNATSRFWGRPPSRVNLKSRPKSTQATRLPSAMPAFEATRARSPAITTAPFALTDLPSGSRLDSMR